MTFQVNQIMIEYVYGNDNIAWTQKENQLNK